MKALLRKIRRILRDRRTRRLFTRFVSTVAAVVVFVTTYALILPAITMEAQADCGIEAHQHDSSCYEDVLTCGQEESDGHHHDDSCYTITTDLVCELEEHQHSDNCFDADGNLICDLQEHTHDDNCYEEHRELTCGLEESDGHQHDSSCYEQVLTCGKEVHVHSAECYHHDDSDNSDDTMAVSADAANTGASARTANAYESADSDQSDAENSHAEEGTAATSENGLQADLTDADATNTAAAAAEDGYVPVLDALEFDHILNDSTDIYYYHVKDDEVIEDSSSITDWKKIEKDTELGKNDLLRVYLSYTIPAGAINASNDVARYRLPSNLHLTDAQVKAINEMENGIAAQYINYDNLEVEDSANYHKYLGAEAVEGTRKPSDDSDEYLAKHDGQEFISAVVRVENIYDDHDEYLGQDLIFTFTPYSVETNRNEYDATGQPTKAGEKIKGWFTLDFNMDQVDWSEPEVTTYELEGEEVDAQNIENPENTEIVESEETAASADTIETAADGKEMVSANEELTDAEDFINDNGEPGSTNIVKIITVKRSEQTADVVFVEEGTDAQNNHIQEIHTELSLVEETKTEETSEDTPEESQEESDQAGTAATAEEVQPEEFKDGTLEASGSGYKITLDYKADAKIPENAYLKVSEITRESDAEAYEACLKEAGKTIPTDDKATVDDKASRFFDIEILVDEQVSADTSDEDETDNADKTDSDDENRDNEKETSKTITRKIEPAAPVSVNIQLFDTEITGSVEKYDADQYKVVHFAEGGAQEIKDATAKEIKDDQQFPAQDKPTDDTAAVAPATEIKFEAESFSIYGVVYTVDFYWEVNGKKYEFSIPGGGYVSFEALMEVLGVAEKDAQSDSEAESADGQKTNENAGKELTLSDIDISEKTKAFVADVEEVEFSNPALVWVGKVESDTTVGTLKKTNNLECQNSANLTEEQIKKIDAQTVKAGDWALISVKPFRSEETLTVTMKNGDQFVVKVTDAQDPLIFIDKKVIIYSDLENRAMLSDGYTYNQYRLNSVPLSEAEGNEAAHWTVEWHNNNYYLKSSNNQYLTIDGTNVGLVNNWSVATPLRIEAGTNPDYRICDAYNYNNVLTYNTNNNWGDGFFSAPGGENDSQTDRWLHIEIVETLPDRAGDWLLYFDDDFDEITIHVGETISLRPYNKWEWKEGNVDVQTAHWNIGGRDNNYWNQIDSGDANGAHKESWDDGGTGGTAGFHWTAYVKKDDQLTTHYWAVQGVATHTGDYVLTNTKNGETITVHVVDGDPVNKPQTITNIANIKVNLFDYDNGGELDVGMVNGEPNHNLANDGNFKNESVNQMGGSDHLYFLSSGSGDNNNEPWNSYTKDNSNPGIVENTLNSAGYPVLNHGNRTSLQYLFDTSQASQSWHGGSGNNGMIAYPDVVGMFQKDNDGYYYFNSNTNYFYYNTVNKKSKLYEHTYTQNSSAAKDSLANDKPIGFFPFHDYDSTNDLYVNQNAALNHHLGLSMELEFMLPRDKKDDNGNEIVFDFSGDDDLWVFVEWVDDNGQKQSRLLLDLGGVHQPIHGDINFTSGSNTSFMQPNRPYTLKVFYLERGGCDSNCSIRFNLPIIQDLVIAKKLTGLTEAEKIKYKDEEFTYEVIVNNQLYNYPNPNNKYEKAIIRDADGTDVTPEDFKIVNGQVKLKDGYTLTITYLDRSDTFTVAEENTPNMENFERPHAERYYHLPHNAALYEEEITLVDSHTQGTTSSIEEWVTPDPPYKLEDTEKVTFTNTLKEKNLEVDKKWKGEKDHPDSITFKVLATVEDGNGGRTPYAVSALKNDDGTDKEFTLSNSNKWRYEIEHLPVNTPDGKFIFYDISEGQIEGYTLTGLKDITAENYNYCNVDVVKLWPDSNGNHTEVLQVVLQNPAGKYYAGVNNNGEAIFVDDISGAEVRELKPENDYSQRYDRLPYEDADYKAVQLHEDEYNHGLATYKRAIIQYELENSPVEGPVGPDDKPNEPEIHKRIDALRDGVTNPDSPHTGEDLTDLYRLYLDYKVKSLHEANGVDLLFVIDHSGSMNNSAWQGNPYRAPAVEAALNGEDGLISEFLKMNEKNQWAAVGFKGPDGAWDYYWSLGNPWQPATDLSAYNAGINGSEVLSSGGENYVFTRADASPSGKNVTLDNEGADILTNYTAGFWRAEQFLLKDDVKEDGRKKVIVFISDGIPTLHIDCNGGTLQGAGTADGSPYYRDAYGGCPTQTLTEFGYFVNDMINNGYSFGENMEFYTIGFGGTMQTESGSKLLNGMLDKVYGENDHSGHFMTISDTYYNPWNPVVDVDYSTAAETLKNNLRTIMGMNEKFTNIVIQDDLSAYVDLCGLAEAGTNTADIMRAAKAKVTMKIPNPDDIDEPTIITLYEDGAPVNSDDAKFTRADGTTKANIIQKLEYDSASKTVKAVFDPEYQAVEGVVYTLSFDVKATDYAYTKYAESGYDKYTEGDQQGQVITGDPDTDFFGTDPDNATSVDKAGFRSNDEAKATYKHNDKDEALEYPHPVIQVSARVDIVKIDETGGALEGAKFNLYDSRYDASKTIEENAAYLLEENLESKKPTDPAGEDAIIRSGKMGVGTYYLVETKAPDGYNSLSGPVKITVTENNGTIYVAAKIGELTVGDKLKHENGIWKLSVPNSAGYELPSAGGSGTTLLYLFGIILTCLAASALMMRKRRNVA